MSAKRCPVDVMLVPAPTSPKKGSEIAVPSRSVALFCDGQVPGKVEYLGSFVADFGAVRRELWITRSVTDFAEAITEPRSGLRLGYVAVEEHFLPAFRKARGLAGRARVAIASLLDGKDLAAVNATIDAAPANPYVDAR